MTEFNSGKDYSSKLQFLRTYLFECLEHREMTHRSLITDNEFMYPQFIVLVNAIYMILDVEDQVKLRRLLHQNEYQFIIPLSETINYPTTIQTRTESSEWRYGCSIYEVP